MAWPLAVVVVVALVAAAKAGRDVDGAAVVIALRAPTQGAERVVMKLSPLVQLKASLAAGDEATLFGIKVVALHKPALEPKPSSLRTIVTEARTKQAELRPPPRRERWTRARAGERRAVRTRKVWRVRAYAKASPPVAQPGPAVAAASPSPNAPARIPGRAIALGADDRQLEESKSFGFKLGERTSLRVGSMSSMMPAQGPDDANGHDYKHPSRANEDVEAATRPGAAVGLTFDLN